MKHIQRWSYWVYTDYCIIFCISLQFKLFLVYVYWKKKNMFSNHSEGILLIKKCKFPYILQKCQFLKFGVEFLHTGDHAPLEHISSLSVCQKRAWACSWTLCFMRGVNEFDCHVIWAARLPAFAFQLVSQPHFHEEKRGSGCRSGFKPLMLALWK